MYLDGLIKNYLGQIETLKEELKKQKDIYDSSFQSDAVYQEHEEKAKEAAKVKNDTKLQILKQPQIFTLAEKIDEMKLELKDLQTTLSDYLLQYQKISGFNQIEDVNGETLIIVTSAKLVKGSPKE